jgi:hypothetical protein
VNVARAGVGVARAEHDLLIAPDEFPGGAHRPEGVVIRGIQVGYASVGPRDAVPSEQDPIPAYDFVPDVVVLLHLAKQRRLVLHPHFRHVYPHSALPV